MEQTALKDFQKEIEEMNEDDARLEIIKDWEKYREEKILVSETIPNHVWKEC